MGFCTLTFYEGRAVVLYILSKEPSSTFCLKNTGNLLKTDVTWILSVELRHGPDTSQALSRKELEGLGVYTSTALSTYETRP